MDNNQLSVSQPMADEPEKGYILNLGMPRFVNETEIRRLRKVVKEKNALIEKFKKYDEERKAYYAERKEEYDAMKQSFDQFSLELAKAVEDGELDASEHGKFMKLYRHWYTYKCRQELYKGKLAEARHSVREVRDDLSKLEALLGVLPLTSTSGLEQVVNRMITMRKHLDTLQSKMIVE